MNRPSYCIRRNPGSGRWVMYYEEPRSTRSQVRKPIWRIMGSADTLRNAIDGIYE